MLYFYENKQMVIKMLFDTLSYTVAGVDLEDIRYEELSNGDELAIIIYKHGYHKSVNITYDSALELMRNILRALE